MHLLCVSPSIVSRKYPLRRQLSHEPALFGIIVFVVGNAARVGIMCCFVWQVSLVMAAQPPPVSCSQVETCACISFTVTASVAQVAPNQCLRSCFATDSMTEHNTKRKLRLGQHRKILCSRRLLKDMARKPFHWNRRKPSLG